jgi:hypothetical protein
LKKNSNISRAKGGRRIKWSQRETCEKMFFFKGRLRNNQGEIKLK